MSRKLIFGFIMIVGLMFLLFVMSDDADAYQDTQYTGGYQSIYHAAGGNVYNLTYYNAQHLPYNDTTLVFNVSNEWDISPTGTWFYTENNISVYFHPDCDSHIFDFYSISSYSGRYVDYKGNVHTPLTMNTILNELDQEYKYTLNNATTSGWQNLGTNSVSITGGDYVNITFRTKFANSSSNYPWQRAWLYENDSSMYNGVKVRMRLNNVNDVLDMTQYSVVTSDRKPYTTTVMSDNNLTINLESGVLNKWSEKSLFYFNDNNDQYNTNCRSYYLAFLNKTDYLMNLLGNGKIMFSSFNDTTPVWHNVSLVNIDGFILLDGSPFWSIDPVTYTYNNIGEIRLIITNAVGMTNKTFECALFSGIFGDPGTVGTMEYWAVGEPVYFNFSVINQTTVDPPYLVNALQLVAPSGQYPNMPLTFTSLPVSNHPFTTNSYIWKMYKKAPNGSYVLIDEETTLTASNLYVLTETGDYKLVSVANATILGATYTDETFMLFDIVDLGSTFTSTSEGGVTTTGQVVEDEGYLSSLLGFLDEYYYIIIIALGSMSFVLIFNQWRK